MFQPVCLWPVGALRASWKGSRWHELGHSNGVCRWAGSTRTLGVRSTAGSPEGGEGNGEVGSSDV
jgi:hypothetical protein